MNEKQFKRLMEHQNRAIKSAIKTHVNGKIDKIDAKLTEYIEGDEKWKAEQMEYREREIKPLVETRQNWDWAGSKAKALGTGLVLVAGAITAWGVIRSKL